MNLTPAFFLSTGLTLALIAMFALGLYSLAPIIRAQQTNPPRAGSSARAALAEFTAKTSDELFECDANAQGPGYCSLHPLEQPSVDRHVDPSESRYINNPHQELRDALHDELHDELLEGLSAGPFAPSSPFTNESHDSRPLPTSGERPSSSRDSVCCPHCDSSRIDTLNRARKAGSTIGSVAGATSGLAMALSGAEAGAVVGSFAGPVGAIFGGLAGAVIAGLVGSAAGCAAGSAVGAAIDDNVLDNHLCLSCGHAFNAARS